MSARSMGLRSISARAISDNLGLGYEMLRFSYKKGTISLNVHYE